MQFVRSLISEVNMNTNNFKPINVIQTDTTGWILKYW